MQNYKDNTEYEILTPNGWEDFEGILENDFDKEGKHITFINGMELIATNEHRFYSSGQEISVDKISVGMFLDHKDGPVQVSSIEDTILEKSYDIFNSESHTILANGFSSHQCDEFAFVPTNMAQEFWSAIQPVLSEGGDCIVTSTPRTDEDPFSQIWKGSQVLTDEFGNPTGKLTGENDFFGIKVPWWEHPTRDEEWARPFRASLGPARFAQEFECLSGGNTIEVEKNGEIKKITIDELYTDLKEDK